MVCYSHVHVKSYTAVNKAYKMLQDEEQKEYLEGVVEEAKGMVEKKVNYKKNSGNVAMYVLHMHEIICVYHQIPHCR